MAGVQAADQEAWLQHNLFPALSDPPAEAEVAFWQQFMFSWDRSLDRMFTEQFHPLHVMDRNITFANGNADPHYRRMDGMGRQVLSKSVVYSIREVMLDLPAMEWLEAHQTLFADFLRNSVGSVEEEAVDPLQLSYQTVERSWWEKMSENDGACYGLHPFQASPYAFVSVPIKDGDKLILLSHVRYHYEGFADHKFEFAISVPLANRCSIDMGTLYRFGRHDEQSRLALKLFKEFGNAGIVQLGCEVQSHPVLFAGLAVPW